MRIAMFGHKRIPSREGGVEIVVEELAARMVEQGHSVTCYNRKGHHIAGTAYDAAVSASYRGVQLKNVWTVDRKGLAALTASVSAACRAALGKYDVVHIHAEGPAAMCWLPKLFGKRVICTIHGLDHARAKWGRFASAYIMAGEKNAVRFADEIIVLSRGVQEYFKKNYNRETVFIPNGVNEPEPVEAREITARWGLKKDSYVLFLGRLVPEKGLRYLIQAWRGVETDKKLVIAGGSSDTDDFVKELKEMSDDRVIYTGFVQGRLLEELYSNAYVYCLPSDLEGMPLSLLEAMSYGNCCLTSDIPECAEVVTDRAVLFRRGDVADLREKLQHLLHAPEKVERFKAEAAAYICRRYRWDDVVEKTLALYRVDG